jgi:hypothetical protein
MSKGKRRLAANRGGDVFDRHGGHGRNAERWGPGDIEDDPLRDLRPVEDDFRNPAGDEYLWPDMKNEYEEDD